jgi:hypothetical protein
MAFAQVAPPMIFLAEYAAHHRLPLEGIDPVTGATLTRFEIAARPGETIVNRAYIPTPDGRDHLTSFIALPSSLYVVYGLRE